MKEGTEQQLRTEGTGRRGEERGSDPLLLLAIHDMGMERGGRAHRRRGGREKRPEREEIRWGGDR